MPVAVLQDLKAPLAENALLWRYMRLSAFFALFDGYVFFPGVSNLQHDDPMEGEPACGAPDIVSEFFRGDLHGLESWLIERTKRWERQQLNGDQCTPAYRSQLLVSIGVRELARRRAAWCWHDSQFESAAMWSAYAQAGVAIMSTVADISAALPFGVEFRIARVKYISRQRPTLGFDPEAIDNAKRLLRPFLLKSIEFEHEKEVRVFTRCSPDSAGMPVFGVEPTRLVKAVRISPLIHCAEAKALEGIIQNRFAGVPVERSDVLGHRRDDEAIEHDLDNAVARANPTILAGDERDVPQLLTTL